MEPIYASFTASLDDPTVIPLVKAKEDDTARGAEITLTANGTTFDPTGNNVRIFVKKPDGKTVYATCTVEDGKVKVVYPQQMLAAAGKALVEIEIQSGTDVISTPIFILYVLPSNRENAVESSDDFSALVEALAEVDELKEHGLKGDPGEAATIQIGTTATVDPEEPAEVTNSGTTSAAVFDFKIPRGETGPQGPQGPQGPAGYQEFFHMPRADFPETGNPDAIYLADDQLALYWWDGTQYIPVGGAGSQVRIATFPSTGWTESDGVYTQTVAVADLLETGNYTYMLPSNLQTEEHIRAYESIIDNSFGAGTFTLTVSSVPSVDLQLIIGGVQSDAPYAAASDLVQTNANVAEVEQKADATASLFSAPEMHRMIFRGKNLGESVTEAQIAAIKAGTFDDIYLGDYWQKDGVTWRVADINYFYNTGDTALTIHHLVIMPDEPLYNAQMNATNTTDGGYVGSLMYTQNLEQAKTQISGMFGDLVLTHREYLTNAVTDGHPSAGDWYNLTAELPNEIMMYGCHVYAAMNNGTVIPTNYTTGKTQLALFTVVPKLISNRTTFWLRDVVSPAFFACVTSSDLTAHSNASNSYGVRPYFLIGQV